jgi:hypothetical protein
MFEQLKPIRLLVELIVVVLGVGIALAADSWREDRELRSRELAYLRAIETDMEKAASVLKAAYEEDSDYVEKIKASLALLQSEAPLSASGQSEWTGWKGSFSLAQFSIPLGTLQALIGSGDLGVGLVLSEELRATLITEYASINTYQAWVDLAFAQALPNSTEAAFAGEVLRIQAAGEIVPLESFRSSPRFIASYRTQLGLLRNIMSAVQSMIEAVDNIHAAVAKELEQRGG